MSDSEWPLVRELFDAVVELPDAERAAHLERAGASPAVRAEVERMLRSDGAASRFLESSPSFLQEALLPRMGTRLGHYELKRLIASGGMGTVFEALQDEPRRSVALKTLRLGGLASPERVQRFHFEAEVLGQLRHPSIAQVFEAGAHDEAGEVVPFIAMELVSGARDLLSYARDEELELSERLELFLAVCEAVQYGHQKGVIHRDLKPGNILVDAEGRAKVIDFGVARATGRASAFGGVTTQTGQILGTFAYMAPEQLAGSPESVDVRSDVYALGVVLFELLEGRPPHELADKSPVQALRAIQDEPPRPSPSTPRELGWILVKALAKEPERRYGSVAELAGDLRRYLRHEPVRAGPPGVAYHLSKWIKRNPAKTAAAAIGVVAFVAITWLLIQNLRVNRVLSAERTNLASANVALQAKTTEAEASAAEARENARIASTNERRATDEKERADREADAARNSERVAVLARDDVLRLSALQRLDDLTAEADRLWPAHPGNIERYEGWLGKAEDLVAELPDHEAKLAELRSRAPEWTEEERARHHAPKLAELALYRRHVEHHHELKAALEAEDPPRDPTPAEAGVDFASLPADAKGLNALAWPLIDVERSEFGGEKKGLVLARRALELAGEAERPAIRDTLAWALFAQGRFDEAIAEAEQALAEAAADRKDEFEGYLGRLKEKIEEEIDPERETERSRHLSHLQERIAALDAEVSARSEWRFADEKDKWWHNQLEKLLIGIRSFADEQTGLFSAGLSAEHGWGVKKRLSSAVALRDGFASDGEHARSWKLLPEIRAAYPGLELTPQFGLVPIGPDPDSGLWEFAHLETGVPAVRGPDGKLVVKEESGLVLVLLPGGTFRMGAQRTDPGGPNYDPQARDNESPVHAVTLSAFFLSKYEMTQAQWERFVGRNPSYFKLSNLAKNLLHPVESVSWNDCMEVLGRLGLSLPSEAQWEYGTRAGTSSVWWTGNERETLRGAANLADQAAARAGAQWGDIQDWPELDDGYAAHAPVNTFRPNPFGLFNVHGNVFEWCLDGDVVEFYRRQTTKDPVSLPEESRFRVLRGGASNTGAVGLRSAARGNDDSASVSTLLGLRPARALTP